MKLFQIFKKFLLTRGLAITAVLILGLIILLSIVIKSRDVFWGCKNCNIILISIDTLGAKHLGLYGYSRPTSPFLDEIAKRGGIVFDNAIVQASWTLPSHTAMFTGRYPAEYNIWIPLDKLPEKAKTLAEVLMEKGFKTQAFSNGLFVQPEWGFDRGFEGFEGSLDPRGWSDSPKIFRDALSWLTGNTGKPFFLFIRPFHMNGRGSLYTKEEFKEIGIEAESDRQGIGTEDIIAANLRPNGPTKEENERFRDGYDVKVRQVDKGLAEFSRGLDKLGLSKNTIVILVADHGEEFAEHGTTRFHVALYDETTHVPLIIFLPGVKAHRISEVVEVRSIPATILELLGLSPEPSFAGPSLFPYLRGGTEERIALSTTALGHEWFFGLDEGKKTNLEKFQITLAKIGKTIFPKVREKEWSDPFITSARSDKWKLIRNSDGGYELYNLGRDPSEEDNLFPKWSELSSEDRRQALEVIRALGADVPLPCGLYCNNM